MKHKTRTYSCTLPQKMEVSSPLVLRETDMHILAILGAIVGGVAIWAWRVRMLRDVGSEVLDGLGRARGAFNRRTFRKKAEGSVLNSVSDPALAGAIFLFALANEADAAEHHVDAEIRRQLVDIVSAHSLDETMAYSRWAARSIVDPRDCIRRFRTLWVDNLTVREREDLVSMSEAIRSLSARPTPSQTLSIEALEAALFPEQRRA
jgi:hypothetical protein